MPTNTRLPMLLALLAACSASAPPPSTSPVAVASSSTPGSDASPHLAASVDDLAALVPKDAAFVVELPEVKALTDALPLAQRAIVALLRPMLVKDLASGSKIDADVLDEVLDDFERATIFGDTDAVTAVARFTTREPIDKLLASAAFARDGGEDRGRVLVRAPNGPLRIAWYPAARVLVATTGADMITRVEATSRAPASAFVGDPQRLAPDPTEVHAYADIARLAAHAPDLRGLAQAGSRARASISLTKSSKYEVTLLGPRVPRVASVLEPRASTLTPRFPSETVLAATLSIGRAQGRTVRDVLREFARLGGVDVDVTDEIDLVARKQIGLGLDDLEALLGGEIALGLLLDPDAKIDFESKKAFDQGLFFAALETRDDARAKKLFGAITALAKKNATDTYKVAATGASLRLDPKKPGEPALRLETHKNALLWEAGGKPWMDRLAKSFDRGDKTLASAPSFAQSAPIFAAPSNGALWLDMTRVLKAIPGGTMFAGSPAGAASGRFLPEPNGLTARFEARAGTDVALLGAASALGIYGVRRYLANAKTSEAKNNLGAVMRAAAAAYEREGLGPTPNVAVHRLCKSATPVPSVVPAGVKYLPNPTNGVDFETGDQLTGWRCLKFEITSPMYYKLEYRQGGPYKGPARGGPDPGPNGFEASAEGDLDGNGKTSLFTRIGQVDVAKQELIVSTKMFIADEDE